jgi:hypothetical protein
VLQPDGLRQCDGAGRGADVPGRRDGGARQPVGDPRGGLPGVQGVQVEARPPRERRHWQREPARVRGAVRSGAAARWVQSQGVLSKAPYAEELFSITP